MSDLSLIEELLREIVSLLHVLVERTDKQAELDRVPVCHCGWTGRGNHYHDARMRGADDAMAEQATGGE